MICQTNKKRLVRFILSLFPEGGAGLLGGVLLGEAMDGGDGGKLMPPVMLLENTLCLPDVAGVAALLFFLTSEVADPAFNNR